MKTIMNSTKTIIIAIAAFFSLSFTNATVPTNDSLSKVDSELKFIGKDANQPLFMLKVANPGSALFEVIIREANGEVIYTEKLTGPSISRTFKLDAENFDLIAGTTFEIVNKTTKQSSVYKISNYNMLQETDVTIAKL